MPLTGGIGTGVRLSYARLSSRRGPEVSLSLNPRDPQVTPGVSA